MVDQQLLSSQEFGSGIPILFTYGWQMDGNAKAYDFEPIFSSSPGFCRICVNLPAMGSTPSYQVRDLHDIYTRIDRFIARRFGESDKFLLVGSSCGAYLARALVVKCAEQVDGLLLRVPLIHPDDRMRDVDPFQPLVRSVEVMKDITAEEQLREDVLIQTPTYISVLREKFTKATLPAVRRANNEVLDAIRNDPLRYWLRPEVEEKMKQRFFAPTLIAPRGHSLSVAKLYQLAWCFVPQPMPACCVSG